MAEEVVRTGPAGQPDDGEPDAGTPGGVAGQADSPTADEELQDSSEATATGSDAEHAHPTQTVTTYERGDYGHRVARRTVRRHEVTEDTVETITQEVPPVAYQAPSTGTHPAPVG